MNAAMLRAGHDKGLSVSRSRSAKLTISWERTRKPDWGGMSVCRARNGTYGRSAFWCRSRAVWSSVCRARADGFSSSKMHCRSR